MTPYEFGTQLGGADKEAAVDFRGLADGAVKSVRGAMAGVRRQIPVAARKAVKDTVANTGSAVSKGFNKVDDAVGNRISGAGQAIANKATQGAKFVGSVGQVSQDAVRHGLNYADDAARYAMNGPGQAAAATGAKLGDRVVRPVQTAAGQVFGTSPVGDKLNPLNVATGAGAMYGAGRATGMVGGGGAGENNAVPNLFEAAAQDPNHPLNPANAKQPNNDGLMGMWNSMPTEARYAIGAGVPLALAGAFMGGRGNYGMGGAMGALGLGAAGLGAAGAGMFGDGPRRMVGQGANALYGMMGGGKGGNPMDQINALGQLSPEFGTTMLMGRDPNMSSDQGRQMYDFLTHNKNIIEQLMPQLQNASLTGVKQGSALEFGMKVAGRCWTGYEPVPGKKPYSNDSCRPVGSKKKTDKKEKKAVSSAPRGKTEMSCPPSSRGNSKPIDDKQREATSPVPTDATNSQQSAAKSAAVPFQAQQPLPKSAPKPVVKKKLPMLAAAAGSACASKNANALQAFGGLAARGLAAGARGLAAGARGLVGGAGRAATAVGDTVAQQSTRLINAAPNRPTLNAVGNMMGTAGAAAGAATSAVGQAGQLAGRHSALALPAVGAAAYYGAGQPKLQSPVQMQMQFRSPFAPQAAQGAGQPTQHRRSRSAF
jgi:hypothetical protein